MNKNSAQKITLRDRKKAQPKAVIYFSEAEKNAIKDSVARDLTDDQTKLFFYTSQALGLNPLVNEICAVTYKTKNNDGTYTKKMSIQVMRDGFLTIAHRSGKFAGLESGVTLSDTGKIINGWAKVYHKDFQVPVYQEADFDEYNAPTRNALWASKPKTMIKKVAESMALRKAFNVNGVYAPEEMDKEIVVEAPKMLEVENGDRPASEEQLKTIKVLDKDGKYKDTQFTKQEASDAISELSRK